LQSIGELLKRRSLLFLLILEQSGTLQR
jgi:hypothetical protein